MDSVVASLESGQQFVRGPFAHIGLGDVQVRHQRRLSGVACQGPRTPPTDNTPMLYKLVANDRRAVWNDTISLRFFV